MPIYAETALGDICSQYPQIKRCDIEQFCPIYYPIARIEVDMNERSFEDFEQVQESVLSIISLGFRNTDMIASLMGLKTSYILQMIKMLLSYGHIDDQWNITELGKESLEEGHKITEAHLKQIFLMDAVNCTIIRLSKDIDRTAIERPDPMQPPLPIPFLNHASGTKKQDIQDTLQQTEYKTLRKTPGSMNINVTQINNVQCLNVRYVKSYLLKLKGFSPMIFVKRFDFNKKGADRYYWMPFSVTSNMERNFLHLPDLYIHSAESKTMIENAYDRIIKYGQSNYIKERIAQKISFLIDQRYKFVNISNSDNKTNNIIPINSNSFSEYNNHVLRLLHCFGKDNLCQIVDDMLVGNIICFIPENDRLLISCTNAIVEWSNKKNDPYLQLLKKYINTYILDQNNPNENPLQIILNVIKNI